VIGVLLFSALLSGETDALGPESPNGAERRAAACLEQHSALGRLAALSSSWHTHSFITEGEGGRAQQQQKVINLEAISSSMFCVLN
jgi:hypothetical protein